MQNSEELHVVARKVANKLPRHKDIKNTIAVISGKGGVGKSTVAVNLACALSNQGFKVGILDADIYGPNVPLLFGIKDKLELETSDDKVLAKTLNGIAIMSIAFLIAIDKAAIWRGPMVTKALQQLFWQTAWEDIDYLIIDMPPGTGDIPLTLVQKIPLVAALVVTTPQELAFADARRAISMLDKLSIPIVGLVENMRSYICSHCNNKGNILGDGNTDNLAASYNLEVLAELPLDPMMQQAQQQGVPIADLKNSISKLLFKELAEKVRCKINTLDKDLSLKVTTIS